MSPSFLSPGPLMLDVVGHTLSDDDARRVTHPLTGGVILFARNFSDRAQLCALARALRALRPELLIAVDHEGGRVQRFKTDGFTLLPPMRMLGALWDREPLAATRVAVAIGYLIAAELRACGIDLSFTPVLDLDYGCATAIGNRAFHRDPRVVVPLAQSLNHGLALAGMANCGKHFPGHGFVEADSHHALPVDPRPLDALLADDVQPYRQLGLALAAVMPAHVVYPAVDAQPAGFSRVWLQDVLRGRLGFDGAIFSDDLSMAGAAGVGGIVERAYAAFDAGCDMALICNRPDDADRVLAELRYAQPRASAQRLARLAARGDATDWATLQQQPDYLHAKRIVVDACGTPPYPDTDKPLAVA